jgi:rSAM/selenodomain-associated transferase 1
MPTTLQQAIIVFAKLPIPGMVKSRLSPPLTPEEAARLYACMLMDTLDRAATLSRADRILFYVDEPGAKGYFQELCNAMEIYPQHGEDLGERMANAFRTAFSHGYEKVAIIGSDSPDLPLEYLEQGLSLLDEAGNDLVFGPADDGGYYLLAMRELHEELFSAMEWSTAMVLEQSLARARGAGLGAALLPLWRDIDTIEDLRLFHAKQENNDSGNTRRFLESLQIF